MLEYYSLESYVTLLERERRAKKEATKTRAEDRARRYFRQGEHWSADEDWKLSALYNNGYSVSHIANILKRSPQAVSSRIKKLNNRL